MMIEPETDEEFTRWLDSHPNGLVLNCNSVPNSTYLILHRSSCYSLRNSQNYVGRDYRKVCSDDRRDLELWAREQCGGVMTPCGACHPQ